MLHLDLNFTTIAICWSQDFWAWSAASTYMLPSLWMWIWIWISLWICIPLHGGRWWVGWQAHEFSIFSSSWLAPMFDVPQNIGSLLRLPPCLHLRLHARHDKTLHPNSQYWVIKDDCLACLVAHPVSMHSKELGVSILELKINSSNVRCSLHVHHQTCMTWLSGYKMPCVTEAHVTYAHM